LQENIQELFLKLQCNFADRQSLDHAFGQSYTREVIQF
jgi:hypothetical protein